MIRESRYRGMTRKHFRALANALRLNVPDPGSNAHEAEAALFENIVTAVARACGSANPRFSYEKFERAAGLDAMRKLSSVA